MNSPESNEPVLDPEKEPAKEPAVPNNEPPAPTATEAEALEQGWMPEDDWVAAGRDPDEWRNAREFVDRGKLLNELHNVKRQLRQNTEATDVLRAHHNKVYESAYQNAVRQLRAERRDALRDEDFEKADAIEERIEELKEQRQSEKQKETVQRAQPTNEAFVTWKARNQWYEKDQDLKEAADAFGIVYASKNPNATPDEVFKHVEKRVKDTFTAKFGGDRFTAPSPVASVSQRNRPANKSQSVTLTDDERKAMETLVKRGHMTEEEYMKDIKTMRGV